MAFNRAANAVIARPDPIQLCWETGGNFNMPEAGCLLIRANTGQIGVEPCTDIGKQMMIVRVSIFPAFPQGSIAFRSHVAPAGILFAACNSISNIRIAIITQGTKQCLGRHNTTIDFTAVSFHTFSQPLGNFLSQCSLNDSVIQHTGQFPLGVIANDTAIRIYKSRDKRFADILSQLSILLLSCGIPSTAATLAIVTAQV